MVDTSFDLLVLFRGIFAWLFVGLLLSAFWRNLRKGVAQIKRVHQIPCDRCAFCTGDYRLKCTVQWRLLRNKRLTVATSNTQTPIWITSNRNLPIENIF